MTTPPTRSNIQQSSKAPPQELIDLKFEWRKKVLADSRIGPAERTILLIYADRITMRDTVEKWRRTRKVILFGTQDRLAREVFGIAPEKERSQVGLKAVCRAFRQAADLGYLALVRKGQMPQVRNGSRRDGFSDQWRVKLPQAQAQMTHRARR